MPVRRPKVTGCALLLLGAIAGGCGGGSPAATASSTTAAATTTEASTTLPGGFTLSAPAFPDGSLIPTAYTCFLDNRSPEITWSGVPAGTVSLALTLVDPDADGFVHWVVWNIPADWSGLPAGLPGDAEVAGGLRQARNDFAAIVGAGEAGPGGAPFNTIGYDGPCPGAVHVYRFTLYALADPVDLPGGAPAAEVLAAIDTAVAEGRLLAEAATTGRFGPPE